MKAVGAGLLLVGVFPLCCWAQEGGPNESEGLSRSQLESAVLEARQAALEAREAARAANQALQAAQAALATRTADDTPEVRRRHKAARHTAHQLARTELQRWEGRNAARPTVLFDLQLYPAPTPGYYHYWISNSYSPYAPSLVVPIRRSRTAYSWQRSWRID